MKAFGADLLATVGLASLAHAADLPTTKAPAAAEIAGRASGTGSIRRRIDCPLTYAGFTLYGSLDLGVGYFSEGAPFNPSSDKLPYGIQRCLTAADGSHNGIAMEVVAWSYGR